MSRPAGEDLARARAAVRAVYGDQPVGAGTAAVRPAPVASAAVQVALERVRSLADGAPEAARSAGPWWRRGLRRFLGRLLRFESVWQHQSNQAVVAALEELSRALAATDAGVEEQQTAMAASQGRASALAAALQQADERLNLVHAAHQEVATRLAEMGEAQDQAANRLAKVHQAHDQVATRLAEITRGAAEMRRHTRELEDRLQEDSARLSAGIAAGEQRLELLQGTARQALQQGEDLRQALVVAAQRLSTLEDEAVRQPHLREAVSAVGRSVHEGLAAVEAMAARLQVVEEQQHLEAAELDTTAFMERFRGSEDEIRSRLEPYVELLSRDSGALPGPVLDIGCGRGEFLDLCRRHGIVAEGLEHDPALVRMLRTRGHQVEEGDALAGLRSRPAASLGAVFSAQVIEHLPPGAILQLIREAHRALAPGGLLVLETLNPASLAMLANTFFRDPGHRQPMHPDTAGFLLESAGFAQVQVVQHTPVPAEHSLLAVTGGGDRELCAGINRNVRILNHLLFGPQEYHVIGVRR